MPLDHYVSQVHLRNFYSPVLGEKLYAIRKADLSWLTPSSERICAINDGSTNAYLREDRKIEDFLQTVEPNYNHAVQRARDEILDNDAVYTIAGFTSYVLTCSPAGIRIQSAPIKNTVEVTAKMLDAQGGIPPPPAALGGANLTELLEKGTVEIKIDKRYPHAIGIDGILDTAARFGNFDWEILRNNFGDNPFFTSDFPVALEGSNDPSIFNRIVPLAPDVAVRIVPQRKAEKYNDFSFSDFRYTTKNISLQEDKRINHLIVRCAESMVFFRDDKGWVERFIDRNRHFRIKTDTQNLDMNGGTFMHSRLMIAEHKW